MFFRVLPAFVVFACVAPEDASQGEDVAFLLDAHQEFPERTRVLEGATASFGSGALFQGELHTDRTFTVTQLGADRVQIVDTPSWRGIQLLYWVEHRDLALTTVEPTFTSDGRGFQLPAGARLEFADTSGDEVHVRYQHSVAEVDAWMDRRDLDVYWRDVPAVSPFELAFDGHALAGDTELFDGPSGERVGFIRPLNDDTSPFHPVEVVERWQGWARVRGDDSLPFDAWVEGSDVHQAYVGFGTGGSSSFGCGGWGRFGNAPDVAAGAWIHAVPDGPIVGRATEDVYLGIEEGPDGWASAEHSTPFGHTTLWIAPGDRLEGA